MAINPISDAGVSYQTILTRPVLVSELPPASADFKGVSVTIKDFSGTPTFGGSLTGGGSTGLGAICTGTAWVVGG